MSVPARYDNWQQIGRGGHAVVYSVFDNELDCEVAIKLLNQGASKHKNLVEGMRREVLISRQLRHPNICPIHDLYDGPEGIGIVMDVIEGIDLKTWLKDHQGQTLVTAPQRLSLLVRLTEALVLAHTRIVHRDLKPANVFLLERDISRPVIMDFGISIIGQADSGDVIGTPTYMAPEQYLCPDKTDQRSDLFALGIMAYEMFTGRIPLNSLRNVVHTKKPPRIQPEEIRRPSSYCPVVPPVLDRLILQLTSFEMRDRPQSAEEVLAVLSQVTLLDPNVIEDGGAGQARQRVAISGGETYLGSPPTSSNANEKPPRIVYITPFLMNAHPVTNADYKTFAETTGHAPPPLADDPVFGRDDHPVVGITWEEARTFAKWTSGRLPTEAEWECAARAGVKFAEYPWGPEPPVPSQANIDGGWRTTSPVEAHPSGRNPFGLWDMCGNVWEWCEDVYDERFYRTVSETCHDPVNLADSGHRVLRGGSYEGFTSMGRCAFRGHTDPDERRPDIGFRIVYDDRRHITREEPE